jgi:transcriptional regulator with XRE-family HTH domain
MHMGRPSKGAHVLAKLRQELGLLQKEMADKVGLHHRTIQDIERGKLELSRRNAMWISEKTGVSVHWLLQNDSDRNIVNASGKQWSHKDRQAFEARSKRWPKLSRHVQSLELTVCASLFENYLLMRALLEGVPNPIEACSKWRECQRDVLSKFASSYEPLRAKKEGELIEKSLSKEAIQEIRDDLDAISDSWESPFDQESLTRLVIAFSRVGGSNTGDILTAFDRINITAKNAAQFKDLMQKIMTYLKKSRQNGFTPIILVTLF